MTRDGVAHANVRCFETSQLVAVSRPQIQTGGMSMVLEGSRLTLRHGGWLVLACISACSSVSLSPADSLVRVLQDDIEAYRVDSSSIREGARSYVVAYSNETGAFIDADLDWAQGFSCFNACLCGLPSELGRTRIHRELKPDEWEALRMRVERTGFWEGAQFETDFDSYHPWLVTLEGVRDGEMRAIYSGRPLDDGGALTIVSLLFELAEPRRTPAVTSDQERSPK